MLKTITTYLIGDEETRALLSPESLEETLTADTIVDPLKTQWASCGFSRMLHLNSPVYVGADNTRVLNVQIRERVLPAKCIRTQLAATAEEMAQRQGYKPGRKQMAELKEEVTMSLLPTSHIKRVDIPVMIAKGYLMIGTGSARVVDLVLRQIVNLFPDDDINLIPISAGHEVSTFLMNVLLGDTTNGCKFVSGESVTLKSAKKAVARFKGIDLASESITSRVTAGMYPVDIAILFDDKIAFTLTDNLLVKGIKFGDILLNQAHDESDDAVGEFDSTVAIMSGELTKMLNELLIEIPRRDSKQQASSVDEDDEL